MRPGWKGIRYALAICLVALLSWSLGRRSARHSYELSLKAALAQAAATGPEATSFSSRSGTADYSPSYGMRFLVAGSSAPGHDDGNFIKASFCRPMGLALAPDGSRLYVADEGNNAIRAIDLAHRDQVSTLCGNGSAGAHDGIGVAASLSGPTQVAVSADGASLYVLDQGNTCIRKLDLKSGATHTVFAGYPLAGSGGAQTTPISALCMDPQGRRLLFVDTQNRRLVALEGPHDKARILGEAEILGLPGLEMASLGSTSVYVFDTGAERCYELKKRGLSLGSQIGSLIGGPNIDAVPLHALVPPGAQGFAPGCDLAGARRLIVWDAKGGLFKLLKPGGGSDDFWLYDDRAQLMSITTVPAVADLGLMTPKRAFLAGPVGLCFDPLQHLVYATEQSSNRVLALKLVPMDSVNPDGLCDLAYPSEKAPGVTRLLIVADSMAISDGLNGYIAKNRQYSKQFELYLNTLNAIHGTGRRYEVLLKEQPGPSYMGSPLSKLLTLGPIIDRYQVDEVLLQLSYCTLTTEGVAWARGETVGDLPVGDADGLYIRTTSMKEKWRHLGPLGREFLGYLQQRPGLWNSWWDGWPYLSERDALYDLPRDPGVRRLILKKLDWVLGLDKAMAAKNAFKLSAILMPYRNNIGMGEMQGGGFEAASATAEPFLNEPFKALAGAKGVPVYDPLDMMRLLDPALFPQYSFGTPHWQPQTNQWFAWMLAQEYFYGDR